MKLVSFIVKTIFGFLCGVLLLYVVSPSSSFPKDLPDAIVSKEPADTETELRKAYFTNFTREEVMNYYSSEFSQKILGIEITPLRLNYPPEDAVTLIRDQTRSTFLEELTHPFKDSFYINGFEPKNAKDDIWYEGQHFRQKITVRYVPSSMLIRLVLSVVTLVLLGVLFKSYWYELKLWLKR